MNGTRTVVLWIVVGLFVLFGGGAAHATEEYAMQTGKECAFCHLNPSGGGELTAAGKAFLMQKQLPSGVPLPQAGMPSRLVRLVVGYVHLLTAILWFGTILYVHLVLKPAYASQGLPRGEVRVGLGSMVVMALTGAILTHYRITSPEVLLHTRFGILLLVKIGLFCVMAGSALAVVLVIGPRLRAGNGGAVPDQTGKTTFTPDELALYDGAEGRPAYFGYKGKVYDATASRLWKGGTHVGRHPAGRDLSEFLGQAPHGEEKVMGLPCVGMLDHGGGIPPRPLPERIFFAMAYMNLIMVFLIVFIVALWRWW
ncbi:MAG TPA: CopD family protein [Desulfuromonadaceae bacterium]